MSSRRITLRIGSDGQVNAKVSGFHGKQCVDYIAILEQMLDAEAVDSELTAEYYETQIQSEDQALNDASTRTTTVQTKSRD